MMAENTILDYVKIEGGYVSRELKICSQCEHEDSSHITFDMHLFKCLEKDCKCEFREDG